MINQFTTRHDTDDVACRELTSKITLLGTLCLIVMHKLYPQAITADRLAYRFKVSDKRKTLDPVLADLWTYGYASHTGSDNWRITDIGQQAIISLIASSDASMLALPSAGQPSLPMTSTATNSGDFLRQPSSSIDRSIIDQSNLDRSIIDQEKELREKIAWLDRHSVTGDKRKQAIAARACTAALLQQHLDHWTREGKTMGGEAFRNKYGPLNYAISCAINGHPIPANLREDEDDLPSFPRASGGNPAAEPFEPDPAPIVAPLPKADHETEQMWTAAQGELQLQMTRAAYDTWVKHTAAVSSDAHSLTVSVPNNYIRDWWQQHLQTTIDRIVTGIVRHPMTVKFTVK